MSNDQIESPSHYGSHPSGVEAKDITMCLSNGLSNAVKYMWRHEVKHSSPLVDIQKAIKYLEFELNEFAEISDLNVTRVCCNEYQVKRASGLLSRVVDMEKSSILSDFYFHVLSAVVGKNNYDRAGAVFMAKASLVSYLENQS